MTEPGNWVPAMDENDDCPYCGGPTVNVGFEFITCGAAWNPDCFGHQVRTSVHHMAGHDETMAGLNALTIRKPR